MEIKQINQWTENPVTLELAELVLQQIKHIQDSKGNCFHPGDPNKTQEHLGALLACEGAWEDILLLLNGDWEFFEEDEEANEQ